MGLDPVRLTVIPNGIDLAAYEGRRPADLTRFGLAPGRRAITCISRLSKQKGLDLLIRATPQLLATLPDHDLLLVGDGPDAGSLRRLAAERGVAEPDSLRRLAADGAGDLVGQRRDGSAIAMGGDAQRIARSHGMRPAGRVLGRRRGRPRCSGLWPNRRRPLSTIRKCLSKRHLRSSGIQNSRISWAVRTRQRATDHFSLAEMIRRYGALFETLSRGSAVPALKKFFARHSATVFARSLHAVCTLGRRSKIASRSSAKNLLTSIGQWVSWGGSGNQWQRVAKNVSYRQLSAESGREVPVHVCRSRFATRSSSPADWSSTWPLGRTDRWWFTPRRPFSGWVSSWDRVHRTPRTSGRSVGCSIRRLSVWNQIGRGGFGFPRTWWRCRSRGGRLC